MHLMNFLHGAWIETLSGVLRQYCMIVAPTRGRIETSCFCIFSPNAEVALHGGVDTVRVCKMLGGHAQHFFSMKLFT